MWYYQHKFNKWVSKGYQFALNFAAPESSRKLLSWKKASTSCVGSKRGVDVTAADRIPLNNCLKSTKQRCLRIDRFCTRPFDLCLIGNVKCMVQITGMELLTS